MSTGPQEPDLIFTPRGIVTRGARLAWGALRGGWRLAGAVVVGVGLAVYLVATQPPSVEFVWIDGDNSQPVAAALPAERWIPADVSDLYRRRMRAPIHLGIRNRSWLPLYDVTVTLQYPRIQILSSARALATKDSTVLLQHHIAGLLQRDAYTPLDIDQLFVPLDPVLIGAITLDGAGIPQYIERTNELLADTAASAKIGFGVRVYAAGHLRPYTEQFTAPVWIEQKSWWPPPIPMKERPATSAEADEFRALATTAAAETSAIGGVLSTKHSNHRIRWDSFIGRYGRVVRYTVDGRPVRMQVDADGDWLVDYELISRPASDGAVSVTSYTMPRPMDLVAIPTPLRPALPGESMVPESKWTLFRR